MNPPLSAKNMWQVVRRSAETRETPSEIVGFSFLEVQLGPLKSGNFDSIETYRQNGYRHMPKLAVPLTDIQPRTAKPKEKPYKLADGDGLYLLVNIDGAEY